MFIARKTKKLGKMLVTKEETVNTEDEDQKVYPNVSHARTI